MWAQNNFIPPAIGRPSSAVQVSRQSSECVCPVINETRQSASRTSILLGLWDRRHNDTDTTPSFPSLPSVNPSLRLYLSYEARRRRILIFYPLLAQSLAQRDVSGD